jgi:hypothetical protein
MNLKDYFNPTPKSYLNMGSENGSNYIETLGNSLSSGSYAPLYFTNGYNVNTYMSIVPTGSTGTTANIGINNYNPVTALDVSGDTQTNNLIVNGSGFFASNDDDLQTFVSNLNTQGSFIGWNTSGGTGETDFVNCYGTGSGGFYFYNIPDGGTVTGPLVTFNSSGQITATSFSSSSDYRIKENIIPLNNSFNVDNLVPVTYINKKTDKQDIGLIAHEVQEYYPYLVSGEKDGKEYQTINYISLIPILINEIQQLKKEVKTLKEKT